MCVRARARARMLAPGIATPANEELDGTSLAPALRSGADKPAQPLKKFALSQYMRCPPDTLNASNFWCVFSFEHLAR